MKIIDTITLTELRSMAERMYGTMVKADVDVAKKIVVIDMDMHADGEAYLLERGSPRPSGAAANHRYHHRSRP